MPVPPADARPLLERLVAFDTTSRESNLALIDFIRDYLSGLGVESHLVHDETGTKANLYATLGPQDRPGIMLSGHTDVVPVDGQTWSSDPFAVTERDGRLYGRGTSDMKAFIAIALAHAPELLRRGLETPVHFAFSYDEEIGCVGVRRLIDMLNGLPIRPRMAIIGEPTMMQVITAHKGKSNATVHVRGFECHSSLAPQGVNAVQYAAELVSHIAAIARRIEAEGPFDADFDIPHSTVHTGPIRGGTALNIVPKDCRFEFEIRNLPQDDPLAVMAEVERYARVELEPRMKAVRPETGIDFVDSDSFPGLDTRPDEEVVTFAKALAGRNDTGKIAFGTEAGFFQQRAGIPCVVCGPGSIEQAHKPDEFIALDQVAKGEAFMRRLADRVCRG